MTKLPIGVIRIDFPEGTKDYVTCIDKGRLYTGDGILSERIIGVLLRPLEPGEAITPANFAANSVFVDLMHGVIARRGPWVSDLIADARSLGEGTLYVIDQRTRAPQGPVRAVPTEDIFGEFDVRDGQLVPGSYRPNPKHYLFSSDGFFQLGAQLEDCLLEVLAAIPDFDDESEPGGSQNSVN
ncbi:MAG TPA: hypothetical protein VE422_49205 [Terriglobia bacterium]|nr:hypothetical protein [Terriglobia bacterium]